MESMIFKIKEIVDKKFDEHNQPLYLVRWHETWEPLDNLVDGEELIEAYEASVQSKESHRSTGAAAVSSFIVLPPSNFSVSVNLVDQNASLPVCKLSNENDAIPSKDMPEKSSSPNSDLNDTVTVFIPSNPIVEAAPKRGRGRPRKDSLPLRIERRGRPKGSVNKTKTFVRKSLKLWTQRLPLPTKRTRQPTKRYSPINNVRNDSNIFEYSNESLQSNDASLSWTDFATFSDEQKAVSDATLAIGTQHQTEESTPTMVRKRGRPKGSTKKSMEQRKNIMAYKQNAAQCTVTLQDVPIKSSAAQCSTASAAGDTLVPKRRGRPRKNASAPLSAERLPQMNGLPSIAPQPMIRLRYSPVSDAGDDTSVNDMTFGLDDTPTVPPGKLRITRIKIPRAGTSQPAERLIVDGETSYVTEPGVEGDDSAMQESLQEGSNIVSFRRKRGRPRKYPVALGIGNVLPTGESSALTVVKPEQKRTYMCDECDKTFSWARSFSRHKMYVHMGMKKPRNFKCTLCDHMTYDSHSLKVHMCSKHTGTRAFMCETCGKAFFTAERLRMHRHCVHEGGREIKKPGWRSKIRYFCTQCDYKTNLKATLNRHVAQVHVGERTFVCKVCEKKCWTKTDLSAHHYKYHDTRQEHERKEKKFACTICSKAFAYIGQLEAHMKFHDDANGTNFKKNYECKQCGAKFVNSGNLSNHRLKVHNVGGLALRGDTNVNGSVVDVDVSNNRHMVEVVHTDVIPQLDDWVNNLVNSVVMPKDDVMVPTTTYSFFQL